MKEYLSDLIWSIKYKIDELIPIPSKGYWYEVQDRVNTTLPRFMGVYKKDEKHVIPFGVVVVLPNKKPSAKQKTNMTWLEMSGYKVKVVRCVEDVKRFIEKELKE